MRLFSEPYVTLPAEFLAYTAHFLPTNQFYYLAEQRLSDKMCTFAHDYLCLVFNSKITKIGLTPANGISPIFLFHQHFYRTAILVFLLLLSSFEQPGEGKRKRRLKPHLLSRNRMEKVKPKRVQGKTTNGVIPIAVFLVPSHRMPQVL